MPFGSYKRIRYTRDFSRLSRGAWRGGRSRRRLRAVPLDADDFVYADPPYDVEFTQYSSGGFGWEDQERTAEWLADTSRAGRARQPGDDRASSALSRAGFELTFLDAPRRISCTGDRTPASEVLAVKKPVPETQS